MNSTIWRTIKISRQIRARFAERVRRRLEEAHSVAARQGARLRSRILTQRVDVVTPEGRLQENRASSWIRSYAYDNVTRTLFMTTHSGRTYMWTDIPPQLAFQIRRGDATARTDDPTGANRWWQGKSPSLGAAYWQFLRNRRATRIGTHQLMQAISQDISINQVLPANIGSAMNETLTPRLQRPGLMSRSPSIRERIQARLRRRF